MYTDRQSDEIWFDRLNRLTFSIALSSVLEGKTHHKYCTENALTLLSASTVMYMYTCTGSVASRVHGDDGYRHKTTESSLKQCAIVVDHPGFDANILLCFLSYSVLKHAWW